VGRAGRLGSDGLVRIEDPRALAGRKPAPPPCTVTDFVDFRSDDGLWRKYRMVYAGDRLFRRHVLADREWNLTRAARDFMRDHPSLVAEERAWIDRPATPESDAIEARVRHQFRALQLDFGVIDFALPPGGDVVVFEINACVQLTSPDDEPATAGQRYFQASNERILEALLQAICERAGA
jgi:hypothetical protein